MLKLTGLPVQVTPSPVNDGVTVIVAVAAVIPIFSAVNELILPFPLAGKPMEGLELVQAKEVPATEPVNAIDEVAPPLHVTWFATLFIVGVGFTVMVKLTVDPSHVTPPLVANGVTAMTASIAEVPELVAVKVAISPVPLAANPMEGCVFVHE